MLVWEEKTKIWCSWKLPNPLRLQWKSPHHQLQCCCYHTQIYWQILKNKCKLKRKTEKINNKKCIYYFFVVVCWTLSCTFSSEEQDDPIFLLLSDQVLALCPPLWYIHHTQAPPTGQQRQSKGTAHHTRWTNPCSCLSHEHLSNLKHTINTIPQETWERKTNKKNPQDDQNPKSSRGLVNHKQLHTASSTHWGGLESCYPICSLWRACDREGSWVNATGHVGTLPDRAAGRHGPASWDRGPTRPASSPTTAPWRRGWRGLWH